MRLLDRVAEEIQRGRSDEQRSSIDTWISEYLIPAAGQFTYGGHSYPFGLVQTLPGVKAQEITTTLPSYSAALRRCPPAFAAQMVRALVLSQARFTFRNRPSSPTPRRTFGTQALAPLEQPWTNATTGELLARMEWHAGLAGNAYVVNRYGRLRVLRPDWTAIIYGSRLEPDNPEHALDGEVIGYAYQNRGLYGGQVGAPWETLLPDEVAHWSPLPDPESPGLGMSWITPAIRDIQGDEAATLHKLQFFKNGAAQPYDTGVLTPSGWKRMEDICIGDSVIGPNGQPRRVIGVYPQGRKDIYRLTFSGGATTECCEDHYWQVANLYDRKLGRHRLMKLRDILKGGIRYPSGPPKWSIPYVEPVEYGVDPQLPLDPYLLGILLGDGSFRGNGKGSGGVSLAVAQADVAEMAEAIGALLPSGTMISRRDRGSWSEFYFRGLGAPRENPLTGIVRDLGLFNCRGAQKAVPEPYMRASGHHRLALLQGLIDTDGHVNKAPNRGVTFTSTSETLARQVRELALSLGGFASCGEEKRRSAEPGSLPQWRVYIGRLPGEMVPTRLQRKLANYRPDLRENCRYRYLTSAEKIGRKAAQCIKVDAEDGLYVTDDFIVTHNTPNMVVKGINAQTKKQFDDIVDQLEQRHTGITNAYRTLYLTAGADATVVGSDLKQLDFKVTQGAGEPLALDTLIPIPTGWTTMGNIQAGEFVFGRDGRPVRVVRTFPVHLGRTCYRVTFTDRTSIVADAGHLWRAIDRNSTGTGHQRLERDYTTEELAILIADWRDRGISGNRIGIPAGAPVELDERDLLVDPYVLGVWLGDGQTAGAAICGAEADLTLISSEIERRGYTVTHWQVKPPKVPVMGLPGGLLAALDALGVLGDKHIPHDYLRSSVSQRLDLLRGLMDTDGSVGSVGKETCEYSSKLEHLARQVAELARSLGYRVTMSKKLDARSRTGAIWRVTFRADPDMVPFLLPRKAERCQTPAWVKNRAIVSIEPVESVPVRCIAVDSPDHLFRVGEGWTLTHNTRIAFLSRVPAPILGIAEGLAGSSLNAGNFGMARRIFADSWVYPTLQDISASLAKLVQVPSDAELWFDVGDMPLLREDAKDAAEIEQIKAVTIGSLVKEGFTPESAIAAVMGQNMSLLRHTGLVSVQLQPPGVAAPTPASQPNGGKPNALVS